MIKSKGKKMSKDVERYNKVNELVLAGNTYGEIGLKFGISKQRIHQMNKAFNKGLTIDPRKIRQEHRRNVFDNLAKNIKDELLKGESVQNIRNNYNLTTNTILSLFHKGIDVRIIKPEKIGKRNKKCLTLYKKGLTGYEIINLVPELKTVNDVYRCICNVNDNCLPIRQNTRQKKAIKINKEIVRLKKKHTFNEVLTILVNKGFKNLNGGELKLQTIIKSYYSCQKK